MLEAEKNNNYMKIMMGIMDLLKDHDRAVIPELPRFEKEFLDKKNRTLLFLLFYLVPYNNNRWCSYGQNTGYHFVLCKIKKL